MAQARNSDNRFSGEYMVQDRDHMSDISEALKEAPRNENRQSQQSQGDGGQQVGSDPRDFRQQGGPQQRQVH